MPPCWSARQARPRSPADFAPAGILAIPPALGRSDATLSDWSQRSPHGDPAPLRRLCYTQCGSATVADWPGGGPHREAATATRSTGQPAVSEDQFRERFLQQRAELVDFGQRAAEGADLDELLHDAAEEAARSLEVRFVKVLEYLPDEKRLLVRAGVGWGEGVVGHATVGADLESPAGYALQTGQPVISNDLDQEERFRIPELLREHGVRSAVNVIIRSKQQIFGVLEADSREPRVFSAGRRQVPAGLRHDPVVRDRPGAAGRAQRRARRREGHAAARARPSRAQQQPAADEPDQPAARRRHQRRGARQPRAGSRTGSAR